MGGGAWWGGACARVRYQILGGTRVDLPRRSQHTRGPEPIERRAGMGHRIGKEKSIRRRTVA